MDAEAASSKFAKKDHVACRQGSRLRIAVA
jgi:hypothetical protein